MPRALAEILRQATSMPPATLLPIVAAVLLQVSFYLAVAVPGLRRSFEARFSPRALAGLAIAAALIPYLVYSIPTGVFRVAALATLAAVSAVPVLAFALWPVKARGLTWQDLAALGTIGGAELCKVYRHTYASPVADLRLDFLGRFMMITVAVVAFVSIRGLSGTGFRLGPSWEDCKAGIRQALTFLPIGIVAGWAIGFAGYRPVQVDAWFYPVLVVLTFIGMYAFVALFEELLFRGVLQNLGASTLGSETRAQVLASLAFGLVHLPFRHFPNWHFAILAAIAGWFYGQAYRQRGNVAAPSIAHALVVTVWRVLFTA